MLIVVLSFSCYHCHTLFRKLKKQLEKDDNQLKCCFVFMAKTEEDQSMIDYLLRVYKQDGETAFLVTLSQSFDKALNLENGDILGSASVAEEHTAWIHQRHISYTPTLLLGNIKIPMFYEWEDIVYFLNNCVPNE